MDTTQQVGPVYDARRIFKLLVGISVTEDATPPAALPGFITFFDPGWSILRLREVVADKRIFYPETWYDNEPFARLDDQPRYRQLQMKAVKDSFGKTFAEQQSLLHLDQEVPLARVVVMGIVIHFLATSDRLFPNYYVRCVDQGSGGRRVNVGCFGSDGLTVDGFWGDDRDDDLGLASSQKF